MEDFGELEAPPLNESLTDCKICGRSFNSRVLCQDNDLMERQNPQVVIVRHFFIPAPGGPQGLLFFCFRLNTTNSETKKPGEKKHLPICQRSAAKKRKVFDSSRQRAEGTDISTVKPLKPKLHSASCKSDKPEPPKKQSNWRRKHEDFIATIRAAKGITQVMKDGGPLPPPPPPSYDPDHIQCPYCQRRFGENAADRHIKFCKEQAARISNKSKLSGDAKGKPLARTQPKPAPVKKPGPQAVSTAPSSSSSSSSSRLPQRSSSGQSAGGVPTSRTPSAGSVKSTSSGYSPSRTSSAGLTSPPSGLNVKSGTVTSSGSLKNTSSGVGMNRKKVYNADSYNSRNHAKSACEMDCPSAQQKFCHECGTKYPVEWAKFCCECGVKRMCI